MAYLLYLAPRYPYSSLFFGRSLRGGQYSVNYLSAFRAAAPKGTMSRITQGTQGTQGTSVPGQSPPRTWNPHPQGHEPLHPFLRDTRIYSPTLTDGRKFFPLFYRTSSPLGPLPCINCIQAPKMCTAEQRVSLTITGPGPSS